MRKLLIFLKYPTPGQVKTRLAAVLGDQMACDVYRACAEITLERLASLRRESVVCVEPADALARVRTWLGPGWALRPQQGATLGDRLIEATAYAFAEGARRVVVVGTDSPWLAAPDVASAFEALERAGLVIGPTEDGGYYLIGLSRPARGVFADITWSTPSVYAQTLARACALKLSVERLPLGYDVDRLEDLRRWLAEERARGTDGHLLKTIEESLKERRSHDAATYGATANISRWRNVTPHPALEPNWLDGDDPAHPSHPACR